MFKLCRGIVKFSSRKLYTDAAKLTEEQISSILMKEPADQKQQEQELKSMDEVFIQDDINALLDKIQQKSQQNIVVKKEEKVVIKAEKEKYGLPIPNLGLDLTVEELELPKTTTMRMFELLQLNEHTSYQEYEKGIAQFKEGMYGEIRPHYEVRREMRDILKEAAIPYKHILNQKYMAEIRESRSLNLSIPGSIENEHPHRFLQLRPVEEFRHTPLIPIAEKTMKEWNEKVEAYHRKGMYLEITNEQVYSAVFIGLIGYIMFQMLRWVLKKEEEQGLQFQRIKFRRMGLAYEVV